VLKIKVAPLERGGLAETTVGGSTLEHADYGASTLSCAVVAFPSSSGGDVGVEPDQTRTLAPGVYRNVSIKSRAELKLAAGTLLRLADHGTARQTLAQHVKRADSSLRA
jgi:hypothetical protein